MNLVDLVTYFRTDGSFERFCNEQLLDIESEVIEIYILKPFSIDSNLGFFEIAKTEGKVEFNSKGFKYHYLFDFHYFLDVIHDSNNDCNKSLTNNEIATILLSYAINDA